MAKNNELKIKKPMGRPKGKPRTAAEIAADAKRTGRPDMTPEANATKTVAILNSSSGKGKNAGWVWPRFPVTAGMSRKNTTMGNNAVSLDKIEFSTVKFIDLKNILKQQCIAYKIRQQKKQLEGLYACNESSSFRRKNQL